jgi:septal ring factor EnvC (AmiA/AmiB activator)
MIMSDPNNAQILHSIGQLTGTVQAMHQGLTARIEDIKGDIRRMEQAQGERMTRIEENLTGQIAQVREDVNKRIDGLSNRVSNLEAEDKRLIEKTAKLGTLGGSVGGALAAAAAMARPRTATRRRASVSSSRPDTAAAANSPTE